MLELSKKIEEIENLFEENKIHELQEELNELHCVDLAEIFHNISLEKRLALFKLLTDVNAAELIEELNPQVQIELLEEIPVEQASKIIMKMPHDELADVLGDLSDADTESYLSKLPARLSSHIRELLKYKEDTAGGIMTTEVITVDKDMTVQETLDFLRIKAELANIELYYIYVVDKNNKLLGVLNLRALMTSPSFVKIEDIMKTELIKVDVDEDQEVVSDTLYKYSLLAVPVVDNQGILKGIVTWDDAKEIDEEETTEEIYASSGISTDIFEEDEILSGHIFQAISARVPWLFVTLLGEFVAVNVADKFDHTLHALPIIAIFMPLLAGLGGNIGTQSITLMVRGLSTGQVTIKSAFYHIFREFRVGLTIGLFFGILVSLVTWGWKHNPILGLVVGFAMVSNMTLATILGTITPFVIKKMGADPAVASGPFIATAIDVLGLALYFTLVTISLPYIL